MQTAGTRLALARLTEKRRHPPPEIVCAAAWAVPTAPARTAAKAATVAANAPGARAGLRHVGGEVRFVGGGVVWGELIPIQNGKGGRRATASRRFIGWTSVADVRLLCFSNREVLFWDGSDLSGNTERWSAVTP